MERIRLLGAEVDLITMPELNELISTFIQQDAKGIIANHNLHSLYLYHKDPKMRRFYSEAHVIHIDGMPLIYWARLLGYKATPEHRVAYIDWIHPMMELAAAKQWNVYYLGGEPGVAEAAAQKLRDTYPNLRLKTHHGFFTWEESDVIIRDINEWNTNLLLVGMGMPRQEHWIVDFKDKLKANALLNAGACFDYIAGVKPTPPRWLGKLGLEWLFRLLSEPKRLASRYLYEPWFLIPYALNDLRTRKHPR